MGSVALLSEVMALANRLDVDGQLFLNTIKVLFACGECGSDPPTLPATLPTFQGTLLDQGYAQMKGAQMLSRQYPPSFHLEMALKV